jgi:molybdenum cofactor guanylyltransferase
MAANDRPPTTGAGHGGPARRTPAAEPGLPPFAGAVLCGGASRRMGRDKALIALDGVALATRVAGAIRAAGGAPVVAVGGDLDALRAEGLAALPDDDQLGGPGAGPLAGILTALRRPADTNGTGRLRGPGATPGPGAGIVFVAACDLVDPAADAVGATVRALAADPGADVAVPLVDARRQWMHAAWRRRATMPLGAAFAAGERAVHAAVAAGGLRVVDVAVAPAAVADADRPSDLPTG